jgi:GNAT superfamily N-acetyltransferase
VEAALASTSAAVVRRYTLTARADLGVFYDADAVRYRNARPDVTRVVSRQAFAAFYRDAASIGFACDGRPIGGILFDGEQAHIAVLPAHRGLWALLMKPALAWLFSLRREIRVEVELDNATCLRFLDRHGWPRVGATATHAIYRLTPLDGTRKTPYEVRPRAT